MCVCVCVCVCVHTGALLVVTAFWRVNLELFVEHFYGASSGSGYHGLAFKDCAEKYRLEPGDGKIKIELIT